MICFLCKGNTNLMYIAHDIINSKGKACENSLPYIPSSHHYPPTFKPLNNLIQSIIFHPTESLPPKSRSPFLYSFTPHTR